MKRLMILAVMTFGIAAGNFAVEAALLRPEEQDAILLDYLRATGQPFNAEARSTAEALALSLGVEHDDTDAPHKCGMSAVAAFQINRDRLDKDRMAALGVSLATRPVLSDSIASPQGWFRIHYTKTGNDACYQPTIDSDGDGIPNYIEAVAVIADSCYRKAVIDMGYPPAPRDDFYPSGGDSLYDIYLVNLPGNYYGLTYLDSLQIGGFGSQEATSFIVIDNDYSLLFDYSNRPLDAVRVTLAHEYFHGIQFGMDFTEAEGFPTAFRGYWMEMSAVWMEEQQYDNINDYYFYLPYYFSDPTISLQRFASTGDNHAYASAVFPLYLSQKYGQTIVRDIWQGCRDLGQGHQFWFALEQALLTVSGNTVNLPIAFREFALWNYFTGARAEIAPNDIGYEEKLRYPMINDDSIEVHSTYPVVETFQGNRSEPQHNAAGYMRFDGTGEIVDRYFACGIVDPINLCVVRFADQTCTDSTEVPGSVLPSGCNPPADTCAIGTACVDTTVLKVDSTFLVQAFLDSLRQSWGLSIIYHLKDLPDSVEVEQGLLSAPTARLFGIDVQNVDRYCAVTMILSAASVFQTRHLSDTHHIKVAYVAEEERPAVPVNICVPIADTTSYADLRTQAFYPYPNPVVTSQLDTVYFKFAFATDSTGQPTCDSLAAVIDLYTVAGEYFRTLEEITFPARRQFDPIRDDVVAWDLRNRDGRKVAGGVYLAVARLYCLKPARFQLAELKTKVAVIR